MMKRLLLYGLLLCSMFASAQLPYRQIGAAGYDLHSKADTLAVDGVLKVKAATGSSTDSILVTVGGIVKKVAQSSITGSGGSGASSRLLFLAPADNTKTIQSDSLIGRAAKVSTGGSQRTFNDSLYNGFKLNATTGTITLYPGALAGEQVTIDYGTITTTVLGGSSYTPTLRDLVLQTVVSGLAASGSSPRNYSGTICTSYDNYGASDSSLPAATDGYIQWQVVSGTSDNCIVGLNASHTNQRYRTGATNNFEVGAMILTNQLWVLDGTADMANTGITITGDIYLRINRTGTSYTLESSTTGAGGSWTTRYTYTGYTTSAAALYGAISIPCFTSLSNLKVYNFR